MGSAASRSRRRRATLAAPAVISAGGTAAPAISAVAVAAEDSSAAVALSRNAGVTLRDVDAALSSELRAAKGKEKVVLVEDSPEDLLRRRSASAQPAAASEPATAAPAPTVVVTVGSSNKAGNGNKKGNKSKKSAPRSRPHKSAASSNGVAGSASASSSPAEPAPPSTLAPSAAGGGDKTASLIAATAATAAATAAGGGSGGGGGGGGSRLSRAQARWSTVTSESSAVSSPRERITTSNGATDDDDDVAGTHTLTTPSTAAPATSTAAGARGGGGGALLSAADDFVGDGRFDDYEEPIGDYVSSPSKAEVRCLAGEQEILQEQERAVRELAEVLNVAPAVSAQLLRYYRWDKDRVFAVYIDDAVRCFRDAGIVSLAAPTTTGRLQKKEKEEKRETRKTAAHEHEKEEEEAEEECTICCERADRVRGGTALVCGHWFCSECWRAHLSTRIAEGDVALSCPARRCTQPVEEAVVRRLVPPETYAKYARFLAKTFVEHNARARWCPRPGCGNAVRADDAVRGRPIVCACGYRFCFACHGEAHAPAACEQMTRWQQKCRDGSETANWILANTQECPRCRSAIEKNGGCLHMTCRQCHHEYCWVCRKDWKGHNDFYQCNRYKQSSAAGASPSASASSSPTYALLHKGRSKETQREREAREREVGRVALEKYLHYYQRYIEHDRSRSFEAKLLETATARLRDAAGSPLQPCAAALLRAAEQLLLARSVLKYSYVYGFYLSDGPARNLFEYLQKELELTVESLAALASATPDVAARDLPPLLRETRLAESRLNGLLAAVDQGLLAPCDGPSLSN